MDVKEEPCDSYEGHRIYTDDGLSGTEALLTYGQTEENDLPAKLQKLKNDEEDVLCRNISIVEFKQENIESEMPKIERHSLDLPIEIDYGSVRENVQSFSLTVKKELEDTDEVSHISDIKQETGIYVQFENESDLLTSHCDLPTLKHENIDNLGKTKKYVYKKWRFLQKDYLSSKLRLNHSNEYLKKHPVICTFCGKTFVKAFEFLQHYFIHSVNNKKKKVSKRIEGKIRNGTNYIKTFKLKRSVQQQLQKCTSEKPFKCEICSSRFANKKRLKAHLRRSHSRRFLKCNFCFKQFRLFSSLSNHVEGHSNEKSFKCDICSKEFNLKSSLFTHLKIHSNEKPFKCDICSKEFNLKSSLFGHLKSHSKEKPFHCNTCSKEFKQKSSLQSHLKIHSNEKPFQCNSCLKDFKHKCNLQSHLKMHSNEKPFKCNICSKEFIHKFLLKRHLIRHTNEKQFNCDYCSKAFKHKSNLTRHLTKHANEKPFKWKLIEIII